MRTLPILSCEGAFVNSDDEKRLEKCHRWSCHRLDNCTEDTCDILWLLAKLDEANAEIARLCAAIPVVTRTVRPEVVIEEGE